MSRNRNSCRNKSHYTMCVVPVKLDDDQRLRSDCTIVDDFDFGAAVQELYPILSVVFEYLPVKDLKNAAKINNVWNEYANKELSKRRECGLFEIYQKSRNFELCKSSTFDNIDVGCGLVFGSIKFKQYHNMCFHSDEESNDDKVLSALKANLIGSDVNLFGYLLRSMLPTKKKIVCSGIIFPKIPNLIIEEYSGISFVTNISQVFEKELELKALMYFCDQRSSSHDRFLKTNLKYLLGKQEQRKIALGGGLITARMEDFFNDAHNNIKAVNRGFQYGIAFLSPKDNNCFEGHSIVVKNTDFYSAKLSEAKLNIVLKKHCTAVIFQCSGIHVPCLEEEFRCHFPTVDFICVTVEGEIGWDTYGVNDDVGASPAKKCKYETEFLHAYSVVILFLSWD